MATAAPSPGGELRIGLYLPLDDGPAATAHQVDLVTEAERLGFASVWARELMLNSPDIPDRDQEFEGLTYLAHLAAKTATIELGTAVVTLPLRHPVCLAKQASSVDVLSGGRFILGVGTGYRRDLYDVFAVPFELRRQRMVEAVTLLRRLWHEEAVHVDTSFGRLTGQHLRPRPMSPRGPRIYLASGSVPEPDLLRHLDGWMTHRRRLSTDRDELSRFHAALDDDRRRAAVIDLPVALGDAPGTVPTHPALGNVFATDPAGLTVALRTYRRAGLTDVILTFTGTMPRWEQIRTVAREVLPHFSRQPRPDPDNALARSRTS